MAAFLRSLPRLAGGAPRAVLVISAHWECPEATVLSVNQHTLLFDYYGFPESSYRLTYPARGSEPVAQRVAELLAQAGIASAREEQRGLDHGVFIPFKLIYPAAEIPIVQLSLLEGLDPAEHLALGQALAPLRDEGVLIVGSGMSYHNLRSFFTTQGSAVSAAAAFDSWLGEAVTADPQQRLELLAGWQRAPGGRECHPRSEHLIPLMVAAGAAGDDAGAVVYREAVLGKLISGVQFGATVV
jgi:aromatic ring-opening dioxygenase catalytic subunit (LigB family)